MRALEDAGSLVLRYWDIYKALLDITGGNEDLVEELDEKLYVDLVESALPVYTYRLYATEDTTLDVFAVSPRRLNNYELDVLMAVAQLLGRSIYEYDVFTTCELCGDRVAVLEVLHNLIMMFTRSDVDRVIEQLKNKNKV